MPWEDADFVYPNNMAPPLEIAVEASNGASDYGNKFGEPVLAGFARSFGMKMPSGERREWVKPIMFSGGLGMIDSVNMAKCQPEKGKVTSKFPVSELSFQAVLTLKTLEICLLKKKSISVYIFFLMGLEVYEVEPSRKNTHNENSPQEWK